VERFIVTSEAGDAAWGATDLRSRGWVELPFAYTYTLEEATAVATAEGGRVRPMPRRA